jgi:hypothetical protein
MKVLCMGGSPTESDENGEQQEPGAGTTRFLAVLHDQAAPNVPRSVTLWRMWTDKWKLHPSSKPNSKLQGLRIMSGSS